MTYHTIGRGSFRGVSFLIVEDVERSGGHRVVQHDYPLRDTGRVQNMGRKTDSTTINIILNGDDALEQRDALVEALKISDAGELEHPNFETQLIQVLEWRERISTRAQRVVSFTVTYVPADIDEDSPVSTTNGLIDLESALDDLTSSVISDFTTYFETVTLAASRTAETLDFATSVANNITKAIRGITNTTGLSTLLSSSLAFKALINNLFDAPEKVITEIGELLTAIKDVKGSNASNALMSIKLANSLLSSPNTHTAALSSTVDVLVLGNQTAVILNDATSAIKLQNQTVINQNKHTADISTSSIIALTDCNKAIREQGKALQQLRIEVSDLYWYDTASSVRTVRQVFIEQMQLLSSQLPSSNTITLSVTEPALVALYRENGDCSQVTRFIRRNAIKHPTFAVGGKEYEVINEA